MVGRLGRHEKALEFAERALALDPEIVEAHLHKAAAAQALGKMEIVRETSGKLAAIEAEKFRRARGERATCRTVKIVLLIFPR